MVNIVNGSPIADTLPGAQDAPDEIRGGDGPDSLSGLGAGAGGTDRLFGEAGDDTLATSAGGSGFMDGGAGNDRILAGASGIDSGVGGAGDDTLIGDGGTDYLNGDDYDIFGAPPSASTGNDVIDGGGGDDVVSGGPGNDILSPGAATRIPGIANLAGGFDRVFGGDGDDILALAGAPQDYAIVTAPVGGVAFLVSNTTSGPGSNVNAIVEDVEYVAFGVTAEQLAAGAVPLTLLDWSAMFEGSTGTLTGRAQFSLSDTVPGVRGDQQVAISIADLLANDFDPDGDTLTLDTLLPTAGAGINGFLVFTAPTDIANEGYDPADFPEGMLLAFLDTPLTAPLTFTYRALMEANGFIELGSTATVTIDPGPLPPLVAADDTIRWTFGGIGVLPVSVLLGNDTGDGIEVVLPGPGGSPGVNDIVTSLGYSFFGQSIAGGSGAVDLIGYFPAGTSPPTPFTDTVTYTIRAADGREATGTLTIAVDNTAPFAPDLTLTLAPGATLLFADLVAGGFDADGDGMFIETFINASGTATPILDAGGTWIGVALNPLVGQTTGEFGYVLTDTSGAGGNTGVGRIDVTFATPPADLRLEMAAQTLAPDLGGTSAVTLQVANDGPAAGSATVRLDLPAGVVAESASAPGFDLASGTWITGEIAANGSVAINVTLRFDLSGTPLVTAEIATASNPDPDSTPGNALAEDDLDTLSFSVTAATTNAAPTDLALSGTTLGPSPPAGTLVGLISGTDPDPGDTLSFGFAPGGDAGGRFTLDGDRLETTQALAPGVYGITLRVTDAAGESLDEAFVIAVGRERSGSAGTDRLAGSAGDDILAGLGGGDRLLGRAGDDLAEGGEGDDTILGGTGADTLRGEAGRDRLVGEAGDDLLEGGADTDTLVGGAGADVLRGGADGGSAVLAMAGGTLRVRLTDAEVINLRLPGTLVGDGAADLLLYTAGLDGVDRVLGFETGRDVLQVTLAGDSAVVQSVQGGTWIGFEGSAGGILLQGVTGLAVGTDLVFA